MSRIVIPWLLVVLVLAPVAEALTVSGVGVARPSAAR
jgi:hypothetical protein